MGAARVWRLGEAKVPSFPVDYEVLQRAVLQVTDIGTNRNKYYALELHAAKGPLPFRIFTHYGRTDDLESNPHAGRKECRFFASAAEARAEYQSLYREKTSAKKGYREVALASTRIGSARARGRSAGEIDEGTLGRISSPIPSAMRPRLSPEVEGLVRYLYAEATYALTSSVAARITARGIETPLGVLTIGQIEKGEAILKELYDLFRQGSRRRERMIELSGEFYTTIPHRIGRSRSDVLSAVIDSAREFAAKQETLQLMKDMLQVDGEGGLLFGSDLEAKYAALACEVRALDPRSEEFLALAGRVTKSQLRGEPVQVKRVFAIRRAGEREAFPGGASNVRSLFHGSRISNWVGILSRGLVLPKIATSMGVSRTDAGWLGSGIYFGDAACTSAQYTSAGRRGTRFMAIARVALGRVKACREVDFGLRAPPPGYDSCHGVRARPGLRSAFSDDEYVIYDPRRQRLDHLVELAA